MEDVTMDETKPFDHELVKEEEDVQPDPDETLGIDKPGRAWSVKIPKHLMQKWSAVNRGNVHLASIRVYDRDPHTKKQRIVLVLPPDPEIQSTEPDEYELDMVNEHVENQIVVASQEKAPGSRARATALIGRINHDLNLRPLFTESYRKRMRERHRAANTPARQIRLIDEVIPGGRGGINMLSSGIAPTSGFSSLIKPKPKPAKGTFERFARMPRNQLLDLIFALYREKSHWSAKELRGRTEQPEAYLKEVLAEIADLHRSGEFNGMYELKPNFRDSPEQFKSDPGSASNAAGMVHSPAENGTATGDVVMDDDDDDDDDDDGDMEEIS